MMKNSEMVINLISDTVTKPSGEMLEAMFHAEVGDDVFRQDPTVNALEEYAAELFGMEAALFCPSGTMTNQIAIKLHTQALDEVICDKYSHIYLYELGGYGFHSGVAIQLIDGENGKITAEQVRQVVKPEADWLPRSRLVVIENSCNRAGGNYYTLEEIAEIKAVCDEMHMFLHLDGARIFNVLVETGESPKDCGMVFDSISVCLSKGLGAPVGSLLISSADNIARARKLRKVMGGGMRQAGYLAAAGLYALKHNVNRLKTDNQRAREIGMLLTQKPYVARVLPVKTNIVIFDLANGLKAEALADLLKKRGILCVPMGPQTMRFVFHLDITGEMYEELKQTLGSLEFGS